MKIKISVALLSIILVNSLSFAQQNDPVDQSEANSFIVTVKENDKQNFPGFSFATEKSLARGYVANGSTSNEPAAIKTLIQKGASIKQLSPSIYKVSDISEDKISTNDFMYVEKDFKIFTYLSPNDSVYHSNPNAKNHHNTIRSEPAWNYGTNCVSTPINVIDTDIDINHPDLVNNLVKNTNEIPNNGLDDDSNGYIDDYHGFDATGENQVGNPGPHFHGSHVAGIAGAKGNNNQGVVGVCWSAKIWPIKIFDSNGYGTISNAISGIQYLIDRGQQGVVNMSFGSSFNQQINSLSNLIAEAGQIGLFFVSAGGNSGHNISQNPVYPAALNLKNTITVAALNKNVPGTLASFSNFSNTLVHLAAPGEDITSTVPVNQTFNYINYLASSGTSQSAPIITAAAAIAKHTRPTITPAAIKLLLMNSVVKHGALAGKLVTQGAFDLEKMMSNQTHTWMLNGVMNFYQGALPEGAFPRSMEYIGNNIHRITIQIFPDFREAFEYHTSGYLKKYSRKYYNNTNSGLILFRTENYNFNANVQLTNLLIDQRTNTGLKDYTVNDIYFIGTNITKTRILNDYDHLERLNYSNTKKYLQNTNLNSEDETWYAYNQSGVQRISQTKYRTYRTINGNTFRKFQDTEIFTHLSVLLQKEVIHFNLQTTYEVREFYSLKKYFPHTSIFQQDLYISYHNNGNQKYLRDDTYYDQNVAPNIIWRKETKNLNYNGQVTSNCFTWYNQAGVQVSYQCVV